MLLSLLLGFITGYLISIPPVGPTNIAIMSKGFDKDIKAGVAMGAGAGFIDMVYILIAFGGVAAFLSFLPHSVKTFFIENENFLITSLTFFGCVIVVFYGIKIMKTKVFGNAENNEFKEAYLKAQSTLHRKERDFDKILHTKAFEKKRSGIAENFIAGSLFCLSSITLPASWFIIVGYFKSYGIIDTSFLSGFSLAFGVLIGTTLWFYTLVKIVSSKSHKVRPQTLSKLNLGVGIILLLLGVFLFYKAFDFALS